MNEGMQRIREQYEANHQLERSDIDRCQKYRSYRDPNQARQDERDHAIGLDRVPNARQVLQLGRNGAHRHKRGSHTWWQRKKPQAQGDNAVAEAGKADYKAASQRAEQDR